MKDSLAAALWHSRREAERTYDRRTGWEKSAEARAFAQEGMRRALEPDSGNNGTWDKQSQQESSSSAGEETEPRPPPGMYIRGARRREEYSPPAKDNAGSSNEVPVPEGCIPTMVQTHHFCHQHQIAVQTASERRSLGRTHKGTFSSKDWTT